MSATKARAPQPWQHPPGKAPLYSTIGKLALVSIKHGWKDLSSPRTCHFQSSSLRVLNLWSNLRRWQLQTRELRTMSWVRISGLFQEIRRLDDRCRHNQYRGYGESKPKVQIGWEVIGERPDSVVLSRMRTAPTQTHPWHSCNSPWVSRNGLSDFLSACHSSLGSKSQRGAHHFPEVAQGHYYLHLISSQLSSTPPTHIPLMPSQCLRPMIPSWHSSSPFLKSIPPNSVVHIILGVSPTQSHTEHDGGTKCRQSLSYYGST